MSDFESVHLLLERSAVVEPREWARRLAPLTGEFPPDLAQQLRYGGGYVLRDVLEEYAHEVHEELKAMGVQARIVSSESGVRTELVRTIEYSNDDVAYETQNGLDVFRFSEVRGVFASAEKVATVARRELGQLAAIGTSRRRQNLEELSLGNLKLFLFLDSIVLLVPSGCLFPKQAADGTLTALDNWLRFYGVLVDRVGADCWYHPALDFWENSDAEKLIHLPEEARRRIEWIRQCVQLGIWRVEPDDLDEANPDDTDTQDKTDTNGKSDEESDS